MLTDHPTPDALSFSLDDPVFAAPIAVHLTNCDSCRAAVASLTRVCENAALLRVGVAPPDRVWTRIEWCITHEPLSPGLRQRLLREMRAPLLALAAGLVVLAGVGVWVAADVRSQIAASERAIAAVRARTPLISIPSIIARPLPDAADVIARSDALLGNMRGRTSVVLTGTIVAGDLPAGTRFERYLERSGRVLHRNIGLNASVTGSRIADVAAEDVVFNTYHRTSAAQGAVTREWSDFFGCTCVKVQLSLPLEGVRYEYYDASSGLLTGIVREGDGTRQLHTHLVVMRKYRLFDGVNVPTDILEADGDSQWRLSVESVRWNAPVPAGLSVHRRD